jgi:hypothetical protein
MTQAEFFKQHGHELFKVADDCAKYGEFLILHPQEVNVAKALQEKGYTLVSVHETEDGDNYVDLSENCDFGEQPYKFGYMAIINSIKK